jgi:hypothetical protein
MGLGVRLIGLQKDFHHMKNKTAVEKYRRQFFIAFL